MDMGKLTMKNKFAFIGFIALAACAPEEFARVSAANGETVTVQGAFDLTPGARPAPQPIHQQAAQDVCAVNGKNARYLSFAVVDASEFHSVVEYLFQCA